MAQETNEYRENRLASLKALAELGFTPYGHAFPHEDLKAVRAGFEEGKEVSVAGDELDERLFAGFKQLNLGDIVGVKGTLFTTQKGEKSVVVKDWDLLAKALEQPPEKFHGLADQEECYRRRYVDLMTNDESRERFFTRSRIIMEIRKYLWERGEPRALLHAFPDHHGDSQVPLGTRLRGGGDADPSGPGRRRRRQAVLLPLQRARQGLRDAHRPRALPQATPRGRHEQSVRARQGLPQRGHRPYAQPRVHRLRDLRGVRRPHVDGEHHGGAPPAPLRQGDRHAPGALRREGRCDRLHPALPPRGVQGPREGADGRRLVRPRLRHTAGEGQGEGRGDRHQPGTGRRHHRTHAHARGVRQAHRAQPDAAHFRDAHSARIRPARQGVSGRSVTRGRVRVRRRRTRALPRLH